MRRERAKRMFFGRNREAAPEEVRLGRTTLKEATKFVQDVITDREAWGEEEAARRKRVLEEAQAGDPACVREAEVIVRETLERFGVEVEGITLKQAAYEIYSYAWGLDVVEHLYRDPTVDEIRVNSPWFVSIQRRGRNERTDVRFKDEEHVRKIITRMIMHDRGVALTSSTPEVESVRKDGSRLTATCPPVTRHWTFVLRKHGTFELTPENLIRAGTLDERILALLELLVKGRANILISGGTGSGKTSLLRFLIRYLDPALRLITLETDIELRLSDYYPDRDIVEFEEHADIGLTMSRLFRTILRYSPDVILTGEIRGKGEAVEAVKSCTRGHDGSGSTIHFSSVQEAIEGTAKMMLEEGLNLPLGIAMTWVAGAFNVVVQMFADSRRGIKKIIHVAEVWPEGERVQYRDLVVWQPDPDDFFRGQWVWLNGPSERLIKKLRKHGVTTADLREAGVVM